MNFFKSIILDDPEPPKSESPDKSTSDSTVAPPEEDRSAEAAAQGGIAGGWSFESLVKTLTTRSESVFETYSRDLMEFGTGLKKETEIIREAASRAVKDLPASLEAGTSAAHGVLDGIVKSTAEIISKEAQISASDGESETQDMNRSSNSGRYSWFDAQLSAIQSDMNTFCEEPEDAEEFEKWKSKFNLDEKRGEIEGLIGENGVLDGIFGKAVPNLVDHHTFWCRYFFRVDKLVQQEKVRANLVKRAISVDEDDDEYSWDVDDDDDDDEDDDDKKKKGGDASEDVEAKNEESGASSASGEKATASDEVGEKMTPSGEIIALKHDEKTTSDDTSEKVKVSGEATSSNEVKEEEEDMGWDEIEDIGSEDEKNGERRNGEELRKKLNAAEEDNDEDLSWDIEDDDQPLKSS